MGYNKDIAQPLKTTTVKIKKTWKYYSEPQKDNNRDREYCLIFKNNIHTYKWLKSCLRFFFYKNNNMQKQHEVFFYESYKIII